MSLIMLTTVFKADPSKLCPSSAIIFHPFLDPKALLMLNDTSLSVSLQGLGFLELTAELCLDEDLSLAALKLAALLSSLLKLLTLFNAGLGVWGLRRGDERGTGELVGLGEGDLEGDFGKSS